jgi:hypothetical protein
MDKFTMSNKKIDLPRDAVIDRVFVNFTGKITNVNPTTPSALIMADLLDKITDMRIVSDGNTVHYSVKALDLAILNYYDSQGKTANPDAAFTAAANGDTTFTFMVICDQGDILALTKESLEFSININPVVNADCTITDLTGLVSIEENVYSPGEFQATYGAGLEMAAEPKIVAMEKAFNMSEELAEFFEIPTGTLNRRAVLTSYSTAGVRAASEPSKIGIIVTTPDRREVFTLDYTSMKEINRRSYLCTPLNGVVLIDYGNEITNDTFGLRGWKFQKGDYQVACKAAAAGKIRYLSCEYVVNTRVFETARAVIEGVE